MIYRNAVLLMSVLYGVEWTYVLLCAKRMIQVTKRVAVITNANGNTRLVVIHARLLAGIEILPIVRGPN